MTRDILYLAHITETIDLIRSSGTDSPATLENDPNIRDATLYRLQTLSESASLLSQAVKARHPEIPWAAIAGFRNRLVHGYTEVKAERVWEVIAHYLAPLQDAAREELRQLQREPGQDAGSTSDSEGTRPHA